MEYHVVHSCYLFSIHAVIRVQVNPSSNSVLTAGQIGFTLCCNVSGTSNLNSPTFTYQWQQDRHTIPSQQANTLSLSPFTASHAGQYTCQSTVASTSLSRDVTVNNTHTVNTQRKCILLTSLVTVVIIILYTCIYTVPIPRVVSISHSPVNVGSAVILTCTVELSQAVDIPVTVNTVWTGPAGLMITNTAQPDMGRTST